MKKQVIVSDFSGKEVEPGHGATVSVRFEDGRKGEYVADARMDDDLVRQVISSGRSRGRRGRKPAGQRVEA